MRRREFITLLGGAAAAWPVVAGAQPTGKVPRIGFLGSASPTSSAKAVDTLRMGLRDLGYVEGQNIVIEFRWAEGKYDQLPQLVRELIAADMDVLITHGTPRSEEHTSELQSLRHLVCRLLLEKKNTATHNRHK